MAENRLPLRSEVPSDLKWHIEDMFASDDAFEKELAAFKTDIEKLAEYQGHLGESSLKLAEYLTLKEELMVRLDTIYSYAMQRNDEDTGNSFYQDLLSRASIALNRFYELVSFEDPELLSLPEGYVENALESEERLKPYRHYLEDILRVSEHTLSAECEALMAMTFEMDHTPHNIFSMINNADLTFDPVTDKDGNAYTISHARFVPLEESHDRDLREKVFKSFYKTYDRFRNTYAAIYAANLKKELFTAKARHYSSTMEAHLSRNNIPLSVYEGLIEAVHDALPEMYRYVSMRKHLLKAETLHMYDIYVPLVSRKERYIPFEEAKAIVIKGLAPLGKDYIRLLETGMNSGWIDVCENKGKRSGAYSGGDYAHHPYVLLNYQGNLSDIFTLAHEMGHSLHSWYANHNHICTNASYSIFVAEIASTCNESLLMQYMLKNCSDPEEKLYLLNHYLDTIKGTIYRQTMFAEFEKITHAKLASGETLSADVLCGIYSDLNALYYGPEMAADPEIALEWAKIPHFYTPFYVYQYATGLSAALAFSNRILNEGEPAVKDYLAFLSAGGSDYPINVLKKAGVDMTTKKPVTDALKIFSDTLDQAEAVIKELGI